MVPEVPLAGESVSGERALTSFIGAQVWLLTVAVHGMGLTLMTKEASSGREPGILAALNLAPVWLEVGIHKLAVEGREMRLVGGFRCFMGV